MFGDFEDLENGVAYSGGDAVTSAAVRAINAAAEEVEEDAEALRAKKRAKKVRQ